MTFEIRSPIWTFFGLWLDSGPGSAGTKTNRLEWMTTVAVSIIVSDGNSSNRGKLPAPGGTTGKKDGGGFAGRSASSGA